MIPEFKPGDKFIKNIRTIKYVHNVRSTSEKWLKRRSVTFDIEIIEANVNSEEIYYSVKMLISESGLFVFYMYDEIDEETVKEFCKV